jgi:hypothetical protein
MGALKRIPLEFIQKFGPRNLLQQGAQDGASIIWSNTLGEYAPGNPVAVFGNNTFLGRVSEVNVQGSATTSVVGNRATINVSAGAISVNGQSASQIITGTNITASVSGGVATLNVSSGSAGVSLFNTLGTNGLVATPGFSTSHNIKSLVQGSGITITDFGTYLQIGATASSGGGLIGTTGNGLTVSSNQVSLSLATTSSPGAMPAFSGSSAHFLRGDGFWGILGASAVTSFNGATGAINWVNGTNSTVVNLGGGNFRLDVTGGGGTSGHTIGNGALGAGIVSIPGFSTSHTLKGLLGTGGTTVTDMGSHIVINSTLGGGSNSIEVRQNSMIVNSLTSILNFTGAGVTATNNAGIVDIHIPGGSGGGITGISLNGVGNYSNIIFSGAGVSVSGNIITILGGSGGGSLIGFSGNGLSVTSNSVSLAMASGANAGAMPLLSMNGTQYLNGLGQWVTPSVGVAGVTAINSTTGAITLQSGTNTNIVALGGGVFRFDATAGSGGVTSVVSNSPFLNATIGGSLLTLDTGGITQMLTNSWDAVTRTLTLQEYITSKGITTGVTTRGFTLPTLPVSATFADLLFWNGTTWQPTSDIQNNPNSFARMRINSGVTNNQVTVTNTTVSILAGNAPVSIGSSSYIHIGHDPSLNATAIRIGTATNTLGFFGSLGINKPNVLTGDLASTQTALKNLGLINLV